MKLGDYLEADAILDLRATERMEALRELVDVLSRNPAVPDARALYRAILEREKLVSTGIGFGIAIPHAKIPGIRRFVLGVGRSALGIDYPSLDDRPVHIIVMIAGPDGQQGTYLKLLARVQRFLKDEREGILGRV